MRPTEAAASATLLAAVNASIAPVRGRLVVACSGGIDSTVLTWAVWRLRPERLVVAHAHHAAQPLADAWQAHVAELADRLGAPFVTTVLAIPAQGNFEQNARHARHRWLCGLLAADDAVLLAHHQDDQAETLLLRALQGRGAWGMPARRMAGAGELRRPLLALPRSLIGRVAHEQGLEFVTDPTNLDGARDRSWLRTTAMPALTGRFARATDTLATVAAQGLAQEAAGRLLAAQLPDPLPRARLPGDPETATEFVRWWLLARGAAEPGRRALRRWLAGSVSGHGRQRELGIGSGRLVQYADRYYWVCPGAVPASFPLDAPVGEVVLPQGTLRWSGIDPMAGLEVLFNQPARRLRRSGGGASARSLLQAAVLPWERARYPLICLGEALLCIPGIASADGFQAACIDWQPCLPLQRPG